VNPVRAENIREDISNSARQRQIQRGLVTSHQVYNAVSRHPGLSVYEYSKILGFSHGRTLAAVQRLEKQGLVDTELRFGNPRVRRIVTPTSTRDLIRLFEKYDP